MSGLDHALGALLGAAVGDAVGAVLEFTSVAPEDVGRALTLPGGGCWSVGPGQFTDDTELALCQAYGLVGHAPSAGFPADAVAAEYVWWCNESKPFDIGNTTIQAFGMEGKERAGPNIAARVQANAQHSQTSKANGALMRATPLTIWAHQLEDAAIAAAAAADARLSHPNQACQDASAAYCIAVAALIRRPGDAAGALAAAEGWAAAHARAEEVPLWLSQARDDAAMENYHGDPLIGWAKHAFLLAFYHLRRRSAFEEGLRHALLAGGDTDTNAAICCGMLGALHGVSGIPPALRSQVEGYRHGTGGSSRAPKRPDRLLGCHIAPLATQLYEAAVTDAGQRQGEKGGTTAADSEPACGGSDGPT